MVPSLMGAILLLFTPRRTERDRKKCAANIPPAEEEEEAEAAEGMTTEVTVEEEGMIIEAAELDAVAVVIGATEEIGDITQTPEIT